MVVFTSTSGAMLLQNSLLVFLNVMALPLQCSSGKGGRIKTVNRRTKKYWPKKVARRPGFHFLINCHILFDMVTERKPRELRLLLSISHSQGAPPVNPALMTGVSCSSFMEFTELTALWRSLTTPCNFFQNT